MVWFQCEDCGENLKKPKLPSHFRICSAFKLSCIDCGVTFGQQSVQGHNQCISEAEKYGPKGQGNTNNSAAKPKNDSVKQKPEIDTSVGLSDRPPWFCKLCNSKATSQQALLLHADGKKHRAKARAFHAANQKPNPAVEEANPKDVSSNVEESNQNVSIAEAENGNSLSSKKRKLEESEKAGSSPDCGEVIQIEEKLQGKKAKQNTEIKIKWKKLIKSSLQTNPEGVLKMKKLRKLVLESLRESGITDDETQIGAALESKVNSSSRFSVDGKYVRLVSSKS